MQNIDTVFFQTCMPAGKPIFTRWKRIRDVAFDLLIELFDLNIDDNKKKFLIIHISIFYYKYFLKKTFHH